MKESKAIKIVIHSLCLYPGVTVKNSSLLVDKARIEVKITNAESIVWLNYLCFAANIRCLMYTQSKPVPNESVEDSFLGRLNWSLPFSGAPDAIDNEVPSELQIFGEWLIDYLFSLGRIKENEVISLKTELYGG